MSHTNQDDVARRAYEIWEREGRPEGRAAEHWRAAEEELNRSRARRRGDETAADVLHLHEGPDISELERALPPPQRRKVREKRNPSPSNPPPESPYFVVALDRARVRIYRASEAAGPSRLRLDLAHSMDFPAGRERYTDAESDQAGRFPGAQRGAPADVATRAGGSIDERLPLQEEHERRLVNLHAAVIEEFLRNHPFGTWTYVAGPALHHAVFDKLSPAVRDRVATRLLKDLVNVPVPQLTAQVAEARAAGAAP